MDARHMGRYFADEERRRIEMTGYRWVWQDDIKKWGLMVGDRAFPCGLAFEEEDRAYWIAFGRDVMGRQSANTIHDAKEALLKHFLFMSQEQEK
jgi:hypothetical protein